MVDHDGGQWFVSWITGKVEGQEKHWNHRYECQKIATGWADIGIRKRGAERVSRRTVSLPAGRGMPEGKRKGGTAPT